MKRKIFTLLLIIGFSTYVFGGDRFVRDDSKEVVIDNATNLMWQDDNEAKTVKKAWEEAINYCENLTLGGYNDWYLPNINQLYSIIDENKYDPTIDSTFQNVVSKSYWSSTTAASNNSDAWEISFENGSDYWCNKTYVRNVRCVRNNN
jgi:hypothetical protein